MVFSEITWDFNPEIFSIGNHGVRWYGLMIALALFSGYLIFKRYLRGDKLTSEMVDSLLVHIAIASIVGARLGHCFFYEPDYFLKNRWRFLKYGKGDWQVMVLPFEAGMSFNMGQLLSLPFIIAGIAIIVWTKVKPRYFSQEQIA